jgi:hypothetical protein
MFVPVYVQVGTNNTDKLSGMVEGTEIRILR